MSTRRNNRMSKRMELTGQKFGRLTVIERSFVKLDKKNSYWLCVCDCGKPVIASRGSLTRNLTKSCGCYRNEAVGRASKEKATHGMSNSRIYRIWGGMKERCFRKKHMHYKSYGGRGITVCNKWLEFPEFYKWALSAGYADDLTIDRVDTNGNYCPDNCRWVTQMEQMNNTRFNIYVSGELTLSEFSRKYEIPVSSVRLLQKAGMSSSEILKHRISRGLHVKVS